MPNLMRQHTEHLDTVMRDTSRETVKYVRGMKSVCLLATIGESDHEFEDLNGHMTAWRSVDFIITAADIACFGMPERGDVIESSHDGELREYELVPTDSDENFYRRSDQFGIALRLHTSPNGKYGKHS